MINILIDTNIIHSAENDFTVLRFYEQLKKVINEIETNDLYEKVQILIPEIVFEELIQQQKEDLIKAVETIRKYKIPNFENIHDLNYTEYFKELIINFHENTNSGFVHVKIIPYPKNDVLPLLIARAINKQAPFEGKDRSSDKGFKDAIVWETLIVYKETNPNEQIILCTNDKRLCDTTLCSEYFSKFNEELIIVKKTDSSTFMKELLTTVSRLVGSKYKATFNAEIEEDLLNRISEENKNFIWLFEEDEMELDIQAEKAKFSGLSILEKNIVDSKDISESNLIEYTVEAKINFNFSHRYEDYTNVISHVTICEFIVIFDINSYKFMVKEYDTSDNSRCGLFEYVEI